MNTVHRPLRLLLVKIGQVLVECLNFRLCWKCGGNGNMMDIGMYGNDHYQVGEMASNSSAYNYYPNYHHNHSHSHSHLHHHHIPTHHHQNPTAEILSAGFSPQNHTPNQTPPNVLNASNHSLGMYHEYGITMTNSEPNFYDTDSNMVAQSYYQNQSNAGDPHGIATSSTTSSSPSAAAAAAVTHQVTPTSTSTSSSSNDVLPEAVAPTHIISSDNGLSYTNLDYSMYGNSSGHPNPLYLHQPDDKSLMAHAYNHSTQTANIENAIHSPVHSAAWQSQHPSQQHSNHSHHASSYQLDNPANAHSVAVNQGPCLQSSQATQLGANPNGIHVRTLNNRSDPINTQQNTQNSSQHGQTVQTYKWMQVKRNVPKPQGIVSVFVQFFYSLPW